MTCKNLGLGTYYFNLLLYLLEPKKSDLWSTLRIYLHKPSLSRLVAIVSWKPGPMRTEFWKKKNNDQEESISFDNARAMVCLWWSRNCVEHHRASIPSWDVNETHEENDWRRMPCVLSWIFRVLLTNILVQEPTRKDKYEKLVPLTATTSTALLDHLLHTGCVHTRILFQGATKTIPKFSVRWLMRPRA